MKAEYEYFVEGQSIKFALTGQTFEIEGRGTVHTATLLTSTTSLRLEMLVGQELEDQVILGVEKFAVFSQPAGRPIGLLLKGINEVRSGAV